ncbi:hypothetical protein ACFLUH_01075 [Chloroflexota bacterium]
MLLSFSSLSAVVVHVRLAIVDLGVLMGYNLVRKVGRWLVQQAIASLSPGSLPSRLSPV